MIHSAGFEYLSFIIILLYGFSCGVFFTLTNFLVKLFKNNTILTNVVDFINVAMFGFLLFVSINFHNFGEFRLYLLLSYSIGFVIEQKTINKPFAKLLQFGYNNVIKLKTKFKTSKCGKILFK